MGIPTWDSLHTTTDTGCTGLGLLIWVLLLGTPFILLRYCGLLWATLGYSGLLWATLGYCGLLWATVGYCGLRWATGLYSAQYNKMFQDIGQVIGEIQV